MIPSTIAPTPSMASVSASHRSNTVLGNIGADSVKFSGCNPASRLVPKNLSGLWQPLKQLMNDPNDGKVIKGFVYKYGLPAAVTAGNFAIPGGMCLYPFIGLPLSIWLSRKGSKILKAGLDSGLTNAKRTPFHRLSDVLETILDPEHNRDPKTVVNTYNEAMDGVVNHVKANNAGNSKVSASQWDKLKTTLKMKEGSKSRLLMEKFIGARKHYQTSWAGRRMLQLGRLGRRFAFMRPVAAIANLAFVALKWKKI